MRKLGRKKAHRDHLIRNLATSLILFERVKTTRAKGKELKSFIDRMITYGKKEDKVTAARLLNKFLFHQNAVKKVVEELAPRYKDRVSGYSTSFLLSGRVGDGAPQMIVQLIEEVSAKKEKTEKTEKEEVKEEKKTAPKKAAAKKKE